MIRVTNSEDETAALAAELALSARSGSVFCLSGELGAGKTAFARGFLRGLGFAGRVTSPTFCVLSEYDCGRLSVCHFDAYRLRPGDADDIGFDDCLGGDGVCLIEWAENIAELIPPDAVWVRIKKTGPNEREISIC